MKMSVSFSKTNMGEVDATISLLRGNNDPGVISIDGMARTFEAGRLEVTRRFARHSGKDAEDWTKTAVADIKHQIDEFRTSLPNDYSTEY